MLQLPPESEVLLRRHVDAVLQRQERLWTDSKEQAIRAIYAGFRRRVELLREELAERDTTLATVTAYFERLVADLTERARSDSKTRLLNPTHFLTQLEAFLALEQRGRWCAVGLADVRHFKACNDAFGHATGDLVLERVATLLTDHVRAEDVVANELGTVEALHARFGGDEFCFLIPDLEQFSDAYWIAERFRSSVSEYDWGSVDRRLAGHPIAVDVGVVCLALGGPAERRHAARHLAHELVAAADRLMYAAKAAGATAPRQLLVRFEHGALQPLEPSTGVGSATT